MGFYFSLLVDLITINVINKIDLLNETYNGVDSMCKFQ